MDRGYTNRERKKERKKDRDETETPLTCRNHAYNPMMLGWRREKLISISLNALSSVVLRNILSAASLFRNLQRWTVESGFAFC